MLKEGTLYAISDKGMLYELAHINDIESPQYAGKLVSISGVISSTSIAYIVPKVITIFYGKEGEEPKSIDKDISLEPLLNLQLISVTNELKRKRLRDFAATELPNNTIYSVEDKEFRTLYWIRVRPEVLSLQASDGKITDSEGFEYKAFDLHVMADERLNFRPSTTVNLLGTVLPLPRLQTVTLLAKSVSFPKEEHSYDEAKVKQLKTKLDSFWSIDGKIDWILSNFKHYSQIIGRENISFACLLH